MTIEILSKNLIFLTLFGSMITFWSQASLQMESFSLGKALQSEPEGAVSSLPNVNTEYATASLDDHTPAMAEGPHMAFSKIPSFLLTCSFLLITSDLFSRWFISKHPPLSNLYESLLFLSWNFIGFFFILQNFEKKSTLTYSQGSSFAPVGETPFGRGPSGPPIQMQEGLEFDAGIFSQSEIKTNSIPYAPKSNTVHQTSLLPFIGGILSSTTLFIQSFADWQLPDEMREIKPLIPALQSNWLLMHVSIMILSYAALLIGCILAIIYLILALTNSQPVGIEYETYSQSEIKSNSNFVLNETLSKLDSLSYRTLAFGFPLLTLGILSGAVWANEAWGSYWSWDPKETWAFITWLIFAFYLHTRLQYGWIGAKSAGIASFGFFIVWLCYLGVNLLGKGLHSYGWLN